MKPIIARPLEHMSRLDRRQCKSMQICMQRMAVVGLAALQDMQGIGHDP